MALLRKATTAIAMSFATAAIMTIPAAPSQAALCNVGFVYGITIDGSKVCVPLTQEVVDVLNKTLPAKTTPPSSPAQLPTPVIPKSPMPSPVASPPASYVNSDTGGAVTVDPVGSYVDWDTKAPVQSNVVVPVSALVPDAAVAATAQAQAPTAPPTPQAAATTLQAAAPTSSATPSAAVSDRAGAPSEPAIEATARGDEFQTMPVIVGSLLALIGLAAVFFGYRGIAKSRTSLHGRRRAAG